MDILHIEQPVEAHYLSDVSSKGQLTCECCSRFGIQHGRSTTSVRQSGTFPSIRRPFWRNTNQPHLEEKRYVRIIVRVMPSQALISKNDGKDNGRIAEVCLGQFTVAV